MKQMLSLDIKGMTCASCVSRIERELKKNDSIITASVNLITEKAMIEFETKELNSSEIINLIKNAGFEASLSGQKSLNTDIQGIKKDQFILVLSIILSLPLVLPMMGHLLGKSLELSPLVQFILATPVQIYVGADFYRSAWGALKAKTGNMDLLISIGTSSAYFLSLYLMYINRENLLHPGSHLYFEGSAVIITLVKLGKYLEKKAKFQTTSAIRSLQKLRPETAQILRDGREEKIKLESLSLADLILIKPGERIPIDGIIIKGQTQVDESLITGESSLVQKKEGDKVIGGSVNGDGAIEVEVSALGTETVLSRIIRLVEDAQAKKPPIQRLVDKVSAVFVPIVILIAIITIIGSVLVIGNWETALIHGVAVLIIACPCALGLATPASILVGTGVAAKKGILIKDAEALEITHRLTMVAFDKTGTLTEGKPSVTYINAIETTEDDFLKTLASIQQKSEHPLALAVLKEATNRRLSYSSVLSLRSIPGKGVEASLENDGHYSLGSKKILEDLDIQQPLIMKEINLREVMGETISVLIKRDEKKIIGILGFRDRLRPEAKKTIQKLKKLKIKTLMLTGDNRQSAKKIADELGIDTVFAEISPANKAEIIQALRSEGQVIAMVGDGVNDAPALVSANVGIALSTGTDVAMHSAGITLMRGDPLLISDAIEISRKTFKKIKQNLFWAFIYNIIGIPLAALGFLSPVLAGSAMALSSLSVVTNSLLLKRLKS